MRQAVQIKGAHDWMIAAYRAQAVDAASRKDDPAVERLDAYRDLLERGTFVMLFGQFESALNETFQEGVARRSGNPDWTTRRGWDIPSFRSQRVPFETKLSLVLDSRQGAFGMIMRAYAMRNHCAHGGTSESIGSLEQLFQDVYRWQSLLRS